MNDHAKISPHLPSVGADVGALFYRLRSAYSPSFGGCLEHLKRGPHASL